MYAALLKFCIVGGIGFLVDAGLTQLLGVWTSMGPYWGRVPSFLCAATITWLLNRRYTFQGSGRPVSREWFSYMGANAAGGMVNYGAYSLFLVFFPIFSDRLYLPVAVGSLSGLVSNFLMSYHWVFKPARKCRD